VIPVIKICGVTSVQDALLAVSAGASLVGLVFAERSPRRLEPEAAREIADAVKGKATIVGVFQNNRAGFVLKTFDRANLDVVQYHGNESPEILRELGLPAIKAIEITGDFEWDLARRYQGVAGQVLLDKPKGLADPDWLPQAIKIASRAPADMLPIFFAGGLSPANVGEVVRTVKPYGVDVASGVERKPGIKNPAEVERFCQSVREAASLCEP